MIQKPLNLVRKKNGLNVVSVSDTMGGANRVPSIVEQTGAVKLNLQSWHGDNKDTL